MAQGKHFHSQRKGWAYSKEKASYSKTSTHQTLQFHAWHLELSWNHLGSESLGYSRPSSSVTYDTLSLSPGLSPLHACSFLHGISQSLGVTNTLGSGLHFPNFKQHLSGPRCGKPRPLAHCMGPVTLWNSGANLHEPLVLEMLPSSVAGSR